MASDSFNIIRTLLDHPAEASAAHEELLERTIQRYPYFHTAFLLLAHAQRNVASGSNTPQLPRIALHVRSRAALYRVHSTQYTVHSSEYTVHSTIKGEEAAHNAQNQEPDTIQNTVPDEEPFSLLGEAMLSTKYKVQSTQEEELQSTPGEGIQSTPMSQEPNVIERFLEHPRIAPPEKDSDFKANITESIKEDEELATETLAKIYMDQGYLKKALGVYKILILKYPEKSSYFATQIQKLEQELI